MGLIRAKMASRNVCRYERKMDRNELKFIMQAIESASRLGQTDLYWTNGMRVGNIEALKRYGYSVEHCGYRRFIIAW